MLLMHIIIGLIPQIQLYPLLKGITNFSYGLHIGLSSDLCNENSRNTSFVLSGNAASDHNPDEIKILV